MPLITDNAPPSTPLPVTGVIPAAAGLRVEASAPAGSDVRGIPTPYSVVAWAVLADPDSAGGVRVDPVFVAAGRTWTPDQFRAAYGELIALEVVSA